MLRKLKKRVETGALVTALVVPLALCVFAFLGLSGYFAFRDMLPPELAALVTAACGIVLIGVILVIAKLANGSGSSSRREPEQIDMGEDLEDFLREHADPVLGEWVRSNPDKAAVTTLVLGIAAGYSNQFRRVLMDLYSRYAESEAVRRSRRRRHER